jgi:DNA-binding winged helix-turn-helix (wHTH) protein
MKAGQNAAQEEPNSYNAAMAGTWRFADLTLDVGQRRLVRDGVDISLGKLTFDLLLALVRSAPNVVTHDTLVEQVWGGRMTSPETVTQRVKLLRDALGDDAENPRYIALVRNQGYRLRDCCSGTRRLRDGARARRRGLFAGHPRRVATAEPVQGCQPGILRRRHDRGADRESGEAEWPVRDLAYVDDALQGESEVHPGNRA